MSTTIPLFWKNLQEDIAPGESMGQRDMPKPIENALDYGDALPDGGALIGLDLDDHRRSPATRAGDAHRAQDHPQANGPRGACARSSRNAR